MDNEYIESREENTTVNYPPLNQKIQMGACPKFKASSVDQI